MAYIEPVNEYVTEAWKQALEPLGIPVLGEQGAGRLRFLYRDYDSYDFEKRDESADIVYSYVYRKGITRKNYLGSTIAQYRVKRPQSVLHAAWPDSFNLELDFPEFLDDALDECWELKQELAAATGSGKMWILKPALGERAHGIRVFRTQEDLQSIFDEQIIKQDDDGEDEAMEMREYVVQEYVRDPLLVDGLKFHLRVYVACIGKLAVYVHQDVLCLFSSTPYSPNDTADMRGHLTNTCIQGESARVELLQRLLPRDCARVLDQVCSIVHDLFEAAEGNPVNFQSLPNAIEFFGLDFIVTRDFGVRLLEVNAYPDFKQTGADLRHVVDTLFKETAALVFAGEAPNRLRKVLDTN